jgi:hypothetical protein
MGILHGESCQAQEDARLFERGPVSSQNRLP